MKLFQNYLKLWAPFIFPKPTILDKRVENIKNRGSFMHSNLNIAP